jgi:outer membrane protein
MIGSFITPTSLNNTRSLKVSTTKIGTVGGAALLALAAGLAQAQTAAPSNGKVATLAFQAAIFETKDGQKALADLQAKFNPVKARLDAKRAEIQKNEDALRKGQNTLSQEAQQKLARDIDIETKSLNRDTDDANTDLEQENQRVINEMAGKMITIVGKYASEQGYSVVLDIGSQTTPVIWASNTVDITRAVIAAYDAGAASLTTSAPAPASKPAAPVRPQSGIGKP